MYAKRLVERAPICIAPPASGLLWRPGFTAGAPAACPPAPTLRDRLHDRLCAANRFMLPLRGGFTLQ